MLQANAQFTRIFNDARLLFWHTIGKGLGGIERRHVVAVVDKMVSRILSLGGKKGIER
jgi:hypothetical protein